MGTHDGSNQVERVAAAVKPTHISHPTRHVLAVPLSMMSRYGPWSKLMVRKGVSGTAEQRFEFNMSISAIRLLQHEILVKGVARATMIERPGHIPMIEIPVIEERITLWRPRRTDTPSGITQWRTEFHLQISNNPNDFNQSA